MSSARRTSGDLLGELCLAATKTFVMPVSGSNSDHACFLLLPFALHRDLGFCEWYEGALQGSAIAGEKRLALQLVSGWIVANEAKLAGKLGSHLRH